MAIWVNLSLKTTDFIGYPLIHNGTVFGGHSTVSGSSIFTNHESGPAGPEGRATLWLTDMQSEMFSYLRLGAIYVCFQTNM